MFFVVVKKMLFFQENLKIYVIEMYYKCKLKKEVLRSLLWIDEGNMDGLWPDPIFREYNLWFDKDDLVIWFLRRGLM
ncbi:hypothetical protein L2E82_14884 [Cichorium intybus]|uniref:Uncharacterized protein n=1 Tax=Cichorium intybus TaxID=13427 RepID=A0ACB9F185_CICIN|nr:hypothetical protein L2E82_14884 [Cichorium intybus]